MKVKWYAHACFRIEGDGLRIVTDPYTPHKSGFATVTEAADIVLRSSDDDSAHGNAAMITGAPTVVTATHIPRVGTTARGLHVKAIPAKESMLHKREPRDNAMYRFTVEGIDIIHFGDVGNPLAAWQLEQMKGGHVAFVPTGGPPTIELRDLYRALDVLEPRVIIPMHYQLPGCKFPQMLDVTDFTGHFAPHAVCWIDGPEAVLTVDTLPDEPQVWVLQATAVQA